MLSLFAKLIKAALWFVLASLLVWFAIVNHQPVFVSLAPFTGGVEIAPWLILFIGIFIGLCAAGFATSWKRLQGFADRRKLERSNKKLAQDVMEMSQETHAATAELAHRKIGDAAGEAMPNSKRTA